MKIFKASSMFIAFLGASALVSLGALIGVVWDKGASAFVVLGGVVVLVMVLGFLDVLTTRIALGSDGLEIVSHFRRRLIPRAEIDSVGREWGSGVSLQLVSGHWVKLPEIGRNSQAQVNTIRAWLKRQPSD